MSDSFSALKIVKLSRRKGEIPFASADLSDGMVWEGAFLSIAGQPLTMQIILGKANNAKKL